MTGTLQDSLLNFRLDCIRRLKYSHEFILMDDFAHGMTDALARLKVSTDASFLKKELVSTQKSMPDCAAESLYRTNKISILINRINELEERSVETVYNSCH